MKTQTTKFLAVLAVLAMVFAVFAVSESTDANAVASAIDLDGDMDFSVLDTTSGYEAVYDPTSGEITVTGVVNAASSYTYSTKATVFEKLEYAVAKITGIPTGTYVIKQTNSALGAFDALEEEVKKVGSTYVKEKAYTDPSTYEFLIPKDGSSVTIEITNKTTGVVVATYVFEFSKVSTMVVLDGSNDIAPKAETAWSYDANATNGTNTLYLNGYTGNTIFKATADLTIEVSGTNTITSYAFDGDYSFWLAHVDLTITNGTQTKTTDDTLKIVQMNEANGIICVNGTDKKIEIEETSANGQLIVDISGGNRALDSGTIVVKGGAEVDVSGSEMAIRARAATPANAETPAGAIQVLGGSVINASIELPEAANSQGVDSIFGIRANGGIMLKEGSTIVTQGLSIGLSTGKSVDNSESYLYVTGGYTQMDYKTAYGVAGMFNKSSTAVPMVYSAKASGGTAGYNYLVGDAGAYGVTMEAGTKVVKTATPTATSAADTITEINKAANGVTDLTVVLTNTITGTDTSLDLSKLLKESNVKALKSLTIVKTEGSITSLTASETIDISKMTIDLVGLTFTGTVKNGTDTARFMGVGGSFGIEAGSVKINGSPASGTVYVKGNVELTGFVDAAITIAAEDEATATVTAEAGFYIQKGTITFKGVDVVFKSNVPIKGYDNSLKADAASALVFDEGAKLASDLTLVGRDKAYCSVSFAEKQTQNIILSNVSVADDLETTKKVTVDDGTVAFGANSLKAAELDVALGAIMTITGTASAVETIDISGDMNIAGTLELSNTKLTAAGASEISGKITYDAGTIITNNGTMTVTKTGKIDRAEGYLGATKYNGNFVNKSVLVIKGFVMDLDNEKTVRLYGIIGKATDVNTIAANGDLLNNDIIYIMDAAAQIYAIKSGTGTIDTSAVSEEVTLSGTIISGKTTFTKYQIVTFIGNTKLVSGAEIIFQGNVIIPEGVTVTIENGGTMTMDGAFGKLTNSGAIVAEGATSFSVTGAEVTNNGTITLAYDGTTASNTLVVGVNTIFNNKGTIAIGEKSILSNATENFINTGDVVINGSFSNSETGKLVNKANVTLASEVNAALTIYNATIGAKVAVVSSANNVTVDDSKIEGKTGFKNGGNKIVIAQHDGAPDADTFGGFIITSILYKYDKDYTSSTLDISGIVAVNSAVEGPANVDLKLTSGTYGRITVSDVLMLNDVDLYTDGTTDAQKAATTLYVSGVLTIDDSCTCAAENFKGILTVTGEVDSLIEFKAGKINAAMYIIPADVVLKTKKTWVYTTVPAAVEDAAEAEVTTVTVTGTVEVAEKVVVPAGMTLKIEGATVTIKEDIEVDIESDGTTFAVLNNTGKIVVDGKLVIDDVTKSKKGAGTIESEVVVKSGNTEIYTTLTWAMADVGTEEATITLGGPTVIKKNTVIPENITIDTNGNNFTVQNAELTIDGELYLNGGVYTVTGTNGKVIVNGCISKDSKMTFNDKEYPAGLYFSINDSAEYLIAGIAHAEAAAAVADGTITYYGDLKVNSIDFDAEGTLVFDGKVEAKAMEIGSKAKVTFNKDVSIDLVTVGVAAITFKDDARIDGTFVSPVGTIGFEDTYALEDSKITVAVKDTVTTMTLEGSIGNYLALDKYQVTTLGDVTIKADLVELAVGLGEVTIGNKVTVGILEVYGDLVVDNGYKLEAGFAYVYGSLTANAATDTKAKATAEIGVLYAGVEFEDSLAAAAVIAGEVKATTAIVAADATVSDSISEMTYSTDVYAEGVKCLTVYASNSSTLLFTLIAAVDFEISDPNADGPHWYDEDDVPVSLLTTDVGDYDAVYGVWDYNVYSVTIVTDAGVKSVAINGIELVNIGGNVFVLGTDDDPLTPLKAGTYKVTYTLKTGYSGTAVLSTETGTILKDNSFVISAGSEIIDFNFQLAGTEPTPEPEPTPTPEEKSEWTITTILLCVLVVLIAIMAVIVALRLNRN